jgi:maltose/moltooligosaccharide transporter
MPKVMWSYFWYTYSSGRHDVYWQNNSKISLSVWDTTPADKIGYGAVRWNGLVGAFGFVVTFR